MTFQGYKLHVILITCFLIIAAGFGAHTLVYGRHMQRTLAKDFAALPGVDAAELSSRRELTDVVLQVADVPDFPLLYKVAMQMATERIGPGAAELIIVDDRDDSLLAAYDRIHLALHEGAATGKFVAMDRRVRGLLLNTETASGAEPLLEQVSYDITVDQDAVYVELSSGGRHLYERIPRTNGMTMGNVGGALP